MHDPYQVLGVRSGAAAEEIKAAFRHLAKQLHPDLHPADAGADQRFQEIVRAYETLSGPKLRAACDLGVARHRRRQAFRAKATTMAITFALTVCSVPIAVFWQELREALVPPVEYSSRLPDTRSKELAPQPSTLKARSMQSLVRIELPKDGYGLGPYSEPDVQIRFRNY
jgi:curved DNA-binding protein CbpA